MNGMVKWGLGTWPATAGLPKEYFDKRGCFIDCRGPLVIDKTSKWGFGVVVLTESHAINAGAENLGAVVPYGVTVGPGAWIGSQALLAGCNIGARTVVAAGTVVRGQTVGPDVMVAGNPARVIARWDGNKWKYLPAGRCHYERELR